MTAKIHKNLVRNVALVITDDLCADTAGLVDILWDYDNGKLDELCQRARALHAAAKNMRSQILEMEAE